MFRAQPTTRLVASAARLGAPPMRVVQMRAASAAAPMAISNPTLKNIEKRWEGMPVQEQAELWMSLRDRMKAPWQDLTLNEKKAAYYIAFGPHGPRAEDPPGEGGRVILGTTIGILASLALFVVIRMFAKEGPATMTKEWQESSDEFLKAQKSEPFTGFSSETYKVTSVQSPPKGPE